jgi:bifunctional non-homologous end joining protein LigD
VKWDGYRAIAEIRDGDVSLYTRNKISINKRFHPVADSLRKLRYEAILDGEIAVVDDEGCPDFQMLQNYQKSGRSPARAILSTMYLTYCSSAGTTSRDCPF